MTLVAIQVYTTPPGTGIPQAELDVPIPRPVQLAEDCSCALPQSPPVVL